MAHDGRFNEDFARWYSSLTGEATPEQRELRRKGVLALSNQTTAKDVEGLVRVALKTKISGSPSTRVGVISGRRAAA
jgi:hypothetical protein